MAIVIAYSSTTHAQCESSIIVILENVRGGFHPGQTITLTSKVDGKKLTQVSNERGEGRISVPCNELFDLTVSNYTKTVPVESSNGGIIRQKLSYDKDMVQKAKLLAMTQEEQLAVDQTFKNLNDTTVANTAVMPPPKVRPDHYAMVIVSIQDINGAALQNETLWITGKKRQKTLKATTDKNGRLITYLPKGDKYEINFQYHKAFYTTECTYSKGTTDIKLGFSYLGTKEIERRMKEEAERIAAEEKRLKEEKERFEKKCAEMGLTLEECHRKEREDYLRGLVNFSDTVIAKVLERNLWYDKLIICDVTGSMSPYIAQLAIWYRLNHLKEKNLQFVLFNDGDDKADELKVIGKTGGIYYASSKGIDSLDNFMSRVQSLGSGGDCPENNLEALLKGVKMARPFKELVMIVDNDAPVKDISLLPSFNTPVHIIACGVSNGNIHPDYLKIARKTKGSIHTMEDDIVTLARLAEGQQIVIGGTRYKIIGGDFVSLKTSAH